MNAPTPDPDEPAPCLPGPGEQLRTARERANLSVHEIAANLRLDSKTVRALESDDYEQLPAPTFVRGYLHGYARLLEVPVEPVIEAFEQQDIAPPPLVADIAERPQARSTDLAVRVFTYLVIAALVLLVVAWWQSQRIELPSMATGPGADAPASLATDEPIRPTDTPDATRASAAGSTPEPVQNRQSPPDHARGDATLAGMGERAGEPDVDFDRRVGAEPQGGEDRTLVLADPADESDPGVLATDDDLDGVTDGAELPVTASEFMASRSGDRLDIRVTGESWVEVYDHAGERLFYNLVNKGNRTVVEGAGPMRIVLGNAGNAIVEFNGAPVDYSAFVSRGIARFVVGGANAEVGPDPESAVATE